MLSQVGGLDGRPDSTIFRQLDSVEQLGQKDKKMKRRNGKNTKRQKPPPGKRTLLNGLDLVAGKRRPLLIQVIPTHWKYMRKTNYFDKSSPSGNLEMRYSNGPDSGCLVTVDEEVVAADDGEHQRDNINNFSKSPWLKPTCPKLPPSGGKVYRLQTNDWQWIQETEENIEAGGHCTLNQDALLFTSGHQYNLTNGDWSKVMEHSNEQGWENLKPGGSTAASLHSWLPRWPRDAPWSRS